MGLAKGLSKYSDYYIEKSVTSNEARHLSEKTIRQIGENPHTSVLPRCLVVPPQLQTLQSALEEKELYEYVTLETVSR